ncbi:ATP-dependent RNA helicase DDX51 [Mustela putorius furo]|uniref:ATP-dependent RNA helicase n=1 Tax=Mustela putorius furo TaxID=9669 RepID=A0A8U0SIY4_MUSPF|nr:ATP-dependent RNA helicase DDX51 [Mustela putorius furo]
MPPPHATGTRPRAPAPSAPADVTSPRQGPPARGRRRPAPAVTSPPRARSGRRRPVRHVTAPRRRRHRGASGRRAWRSSTSRGTRAPRRPGRRARRAAGRARCWSGCRSGPESGSSDSSRSSARPHGRRGRRRRRGGGGGDRADRGGAKAAGRRGARTRRPGSGRRWTARTCAQGAARRRRARAARTPGARGRRSTQADGPRERRRGLQPTPCSSGPWGEAGRPRSSLSCLRGWLSPAVLERVSLKTRCLSSTSPQCTPTCRRSCGHTASRPTSQAAVIPALLESTADGFLVARGGYRPRDLCVSAPTGSGKTLAFVIPVVQALLGRAICQVRALVVLPTKELAQQVCKVFNIYTDATPLRVALITGQKSLVKEQESLVQKTADGFRCLADVVVATPGRLVDHIDQTPGFSLLHLRFLVIDEADRMIDSMHQSWLPRVVEAAFPSDGAKDPFVLLQRRQPQAPTAASISCPQMPLQKLLFSATLTQNPEKLQQLGLHQPWLFSTGLARRDPGDSDADRDSGGKYAFPAGLSHHYVPCSLRTKPLAILHLILEKNFSRVLCFTNSRENSHRLFLLVQAFGGVTAAEFSSRCGPGQRKAVLKQFEQGKIQLLISTDATARGIDVQGVQLVVNYDAPQYLRTYVHRVGRTARAGRTGQAFTLLLKVQERRFLRMLAEAGVPDMTRQDIPSELLQPLVPRYEEALSQLERAVKEERRQKAP